MPIRRIPGTDVSYHLITYDEEGRERRESDGKPLSVEIRLRLERTTAAAKGDPAAGITDVFLLSHGWKGDVPAAIEQYDRWVREMAKSDDVKVARQRKGGFRPLIVAMHWPSLPWGDEKIPARGGGSPGMLGVDDNAERDAIELFARRIADTPRARRALRDVFAAVEDEQITDTLPLTIRGAYETLFQESRLTAADVAGAPGSDQDGWDPERIFQEAREDDADDTPMLLGFKDRLRDALLMPLRQLSFWKMKDRARAFGETGAHALLRDLQTAAPDARFHLMGHSFGCIVVAATVAGGPSSMLPRPVKSLFLVQGALSLWSFCEDIPHAHGKQGYFHRILSSGLVDGPIVTTRSRHDSAVGTLYPRGAQLRQDVVLGDELPKYGGLGTFGAQGLGALAEDMRLGSTTYNYQFAPRRVYNLEASAVIRDGGPPSGAHSDIAHPEVAHALMAAAIG